MIGDSCMKRFLAETTAAVLVGGMGTRLRPVVADCPKVLAPVGGRPWLTYILDQLAEAGVRDCVLLTGYRADQVRETLGERHAQMRLRYSTEPEPLGTGGALRHAQERFSSPQVLVVNGDSFIDVDLALFHDFHHWLAADVSMVLAWVSDVSRFGKVDVAADGRILGFREKHGGGPGWIHSGICLLNRARIEEIPAKRFVSLEREMFPRWARAANFQGFRCRSPFLDIGTPESYAQAEAFLDVSSACA